MGLKTKTKYTIYSIIIFLTSGIYFFLAYIGFSSQSIDIKSTDKFTGRVIERGVTERKSSKHSSTVFYLTIDGLQETLGIYWMDKNYSGLIDAIQPGDMITVYYLGKSNSENINIDLVQIEKDGQIIIEQKEFKKKQSALIYIGLIGGLFTVGLTVWYYNKYVRLGWQFCTQQTNEWTINMDWPPRHGGRDGQPATTCLCNAGVQCGY